MRQQSAIRAIPGHRYPLSGITPDVVRAWDGFSMGVAQSGDKQIIQIGAAKHDTADNLTQAKSNAEYRLRSSRRDEQLGPGYPRGKVPVPRKPIPDLHQDGG